MEGWLFTKDLKLFLLSENTHILIVLKLSISSFKKVSNVNLLLDVLYKLIRFNSVDFWKVFPLIVEKKSMHNAA